MAHLRHDLMFLIIVWLWALFVALLPIVGLLCLGMIIAGIVFFRRRFAKITVLLGTIGLIGWTSFIIPHWFPRAIASKLSFTVNDTQMPPGGMWHGNHMGSKELTYDGQFNADIRLPDGRVFVGPATRVNLEYDKGKVINLFINSSLLPLDEAATLTGKIITDWKFDRKNFDQWIDDRRARKTGFDTTRFSSNRNFDLPSTTLELAKASDEYQLQLGVWWEISASPASGPSTTASTP